MIVENRRILQKTSVDHRKRYGMPEPGLPGRSAKEFAEGPAGEWCGEKEIPEECHLEIMKDSAKPDGRHLRPGCIPGDDVKENGGCQAHSGAHDSDSAALAEKLAEIRVVFFRAAKTALHDRAYTYFESRENS